MRETIVLVLLSVLLGASAVAQEAEPAEADDAEAAEARAPEVEEERDNSGLFRPSEEIWADSAISFPVDI